jgi:hypothetical protein
MARTGYASLFQPHIGGVVPSIGSGEPEPTAVIGDGGPAAVPEGHGEDEEVEEGGARKKQKMEEGEEEEGKKSVVVREEHNDKGLLFKFAPDLQALVNPDPESLVRFSCSSFSSSSPLSFLRRLTFPLSFSTRADPRYGRPRPPPRADLDRSDPSGVCRGGGSEGD